MASAAARIRMTEEEYLAFERASDEKHEYIDGEIFAMSGASRKHSRVVLLLLSELQYALRGRKCEVYNNDVRVHIPTSRRYVYPDGSIVCGHADFMDDESDTLLNPRVVVEVLSPSTEHYDQGDKFLQYKSISSLKHYVVAAQDKPHVEVFTRQLNGTWTCMKYEAGQKVALPAIECEIDIDQVYANVSRVEVTRVSGD